MLIGKEETRAGHMDLDEGSTDAGGPILRHRGWREHRCRAGRKRSQGRGRHQYQNFEGYNLRCLVVGVGSGGGVTERIRHPETDHA